jgi:DnaJ-class molecular chaperone
MKCKKCNGTGRIYMPFIGHTQPLCPYCKGEGKILVGKKSSGRHRGRLRYEG